MNEECVFTEVLPASEAEVDVSKKRRTLDEVNPALIEARMEDFEKSFEARGAGMVDVDHESLLTAGCMSEYANSIFMTWVERGKQYPGLA